MTRPPKVAETRQQGRTCWYHTDRISDLSGDCFSIAFWQQRNAVTGSATGRGTTWFVRDGDHPLVLRHYRRGGLIGKFIADRFLFTGTHRSRAMAEFSLLHQMREAGLPVPAPVAAQLQRSGLFYRADLIISHIANSADLVCLLKKKNLSEPQWQKIGAVIRQFHDAGIDHTDLNAHNILLDDQETVWLIDFDKCRQRNDGIWKQKNLQRLLRSLRKEKNLNPALHWQESDWLPLMTGYQGNPP